MENKSNTIQKNKKRIFIFYILLCVIVITSGYLYYREVERNTKSQKEVILQMIAETKIKQISHWYLDKVHDAEVITGNSLLKKIIIEYLGGVEEEEVLEYFNQIKSEHDYYNILLTDDKGNVLISALDKITGTDSVQVETIKNAVLQRKVISTDLYRSTSNNKIYIDFVSPLTDSNNNIIAVMVFTFDPEEFLYPLVINWPTPSQTAESYLFRKEGERVLFLNDLRHKKNSALLLSIDLTKKELPAIQTVLGYKGIFTGKDYRNINVFAYLSAIPGTNWYFVSKIDSDEMLEGLYDRVAVIVVIVLLIVITIATGLSFIYNQRQKNLYRKLYLKEKEIWQQQEKFKVTIDSLGEGVITISIDGKIQYMNSLAEKLTGWGIREAKGRKLNEIYSVINEETGERENNIIEKVLKHGIVKELANHTILISKTGDKIPVMDTGSPIYDTDGKVIGIAIVFQNETEKRERINQIKESEERLRSTLNNILGGCQLIGFDYKYLFINKTALKYAQKTKEELLGKTMMECDPGIENTEMFVVLKKCMEERVTENIENYFEYANGNKRCFNLRFEPVPEGLFIFLEDITEQKKNKEAREEIYNRIEKIAEHIPGVIYQYKIDKEGKSFFPWSSSGSTKIYGVPPEELANDAAFVFNIIHPDDVERVTKTIKESAEKLTIWNDEYRVMLPNGNQIWVEGTAAPEKQKDGSIIWHGVILDITKRKMAQEKIRENEVFLSSVFDSVNDAIFTVSMPDRIIQYANKGVTNIFGYNPSEVVGKSTKILYANEELYENYGIKLNKAINKKKKFVNEEIEFEKSDGTKIYCDVQTTFLNEFGRKDVVISVLRDVTEQRKMVNELITAKEKAEEMNSLKSNFFANMSHELRTPLIGINGFAEIMCNDLHQPEFKEMAKGILSSGSRLSETLNLILDLTRLETEKTDITLHHTDLVKESRKIISEFKGAAEMKKLYLEFSSSNNSISYRIDPRAFRNILCNLINNAIKFTNSGEIKVDLTLNGKDVIIKVIDTGIGIAEEHYELIFEEFRQVSEGLSRNFEGSGLGLNITKKMVEKYGGRISVESELNKGTTFTVEFKQKETVSIKEEEKMEHKDALKELVKKNIDKPLALLLDDEPIANDVLKVFVKNVITLDYSETVDKAMKMVSEKKYDLIFMDINLRRGIDGRQATQMIRKIKDYEDTPIVAFTAFAMAGDREEFLSAGCTHYLSKPFTKEEVINLIYEIFESKE